MSNTTGPEEELNNYNSQWVSFHIRDHLKDGEITVQNTVIEGGEFHSPTDRRKSLHEDEIDYMTIESDGIGEICARGRRGSEGRLDLFHGDTKICELHWENRGGEFHNLVEVLDDNSKYRIEHGGWSPQAGPLGHVFVDISEKKKK
ncbi:Terrelysin [Penicillium cataractarum]|uniref:Terrelysin n=1 Tax=Penicillium cataractarum TaxID=2100454 RepID=A0A9W9VUP2_9EURO|nr:Terrelysin [Penicillium cataractarum]KAJ5389515.1 Terrelysin [Penicillium cataractarum]